jgi:Rhs element Vgr protein
MTTATAKPTQAGVSTIAVLIDGTPITGEFQVLSATVSNELGRIPSATVHLLDGEPAKQTFAASDTDLFVPGREIEIQLGYQGSDATVFAGVVVANRIRVRRAGSLLAVECRDKAVRMTSGRHSRYFTDTTDGQLLDELIGGYGLARDVASTTPQLHEVVQFDSTDWDFLVCRAEANGHVVAVRDGKVTVGPPATGGRPVTTAAFGSTVLELDAEVDARLQPPGVTARAWNLPDQPLLSTDAAEPQLPASGNLAAAQLSDVFGPDPDLLSTGATLGEPELQAWADGRLLKDRLAKVRGRVRVQGLGGVTAGDMVEVDGIGRRFAGPQYVSGVRHTFDAGNWETDIAFGLPPEAHAVRYPVTAPPAGGLLPGVNGLQIGVVTALQGDPDGADRIRVRVPLVSDSDDGGWARLATLDAGDKRGTCFRPEIDDEVVVGFLDGDPRFPVVLGQLHGSARAAPVPGSDDNHVKGYTSRSQLSLTFDDDTVVIALETPAGNKLTMSEDAKAVTLADQNGNSITLDDGGITITSAKDVAIKASGDITLAGTNVGADAQAAFKAKGQSGAELTSSGTLKVQGSLVQIN